LWVASSGVTLSQSFYLCLTGYRQRRAAVPTNSPMTIVFETLDFLRKSERVVQ
jgi:hypothetical protein